MALPGLCRTLDRFRPGGHGVPVMAFAPVETPRPLSPAPHGPSVVVNWSFLGFSTAVGYLKKFICFCLCIFFQEIVEHI